MKAFCSHCNKSTEYITKIEELFGKIDGRYYSFNGERAYCAVCGNQIFTPIDVSERNSSRLREVLNGIERRV